MRIALIGQAAFGEAVFRRLLEAGEELVAVSTIAGTPERPDPLHAAASTAGVPVFPTARLKKPDVLDAFAATHPDLGVMAFVTHILPQRVLDLPALGTIQYHPSLLPRHRGINAMHWAVRMGEPETGLSIFWVDAGIDTGPVLLQKRVPIDPDDTVASLYFDKLFALGVDSMAEAVRMVREGVAPKIPQDESAATYEPPADDSNSAIDWSWPGQRVYDLLRGSIPTPGAHAQLRGQTVRFWEARFAPVALSGAPGTVLSIGDTIDVELAGGVLHAKRLSLDGGKKLLAAEFATAANLRAGDRLESGEVSP